MLQAQGVNIPRDLTGDEKRQLQDDVENMKVAQLKEVCRALSLTVSGRKSELQDKIMRKISDNHGYSAENYTLKLILMLNTIKWAASDRVDLQDPGEVLQDLVRGRSMIRSDDLTIVDVNGPMNHRAPTNSIANVSFVQPSRYAAYSQVTPTSHQQRKQPQPLGETVIYFKQSPFYKLTRLLMKPMCIEAPAKNRRHDRIDFTLTGDDYEGIQSGRYRVFWYSGRIVSNMSIRDNADLEYPDHFSIYVNGVDATPTIGSLKNRPADLTSGLRRGKNCINLSFGPFHGSASVRGYMFYLNKVEVIKIDAIVQTIVERPHISKVADLQILKGDDDDDDDDLIIEGAEVVTLKCPITMARMKIPGKSVKCKHLACFDLPAFLQLQSQAPMWKCIVCNDPITFGDLAVDEFFKDITENTNDNVEFIELENDGNWKPKVEEGQLESEDEIEKAIVMDLNSPKNDRVPRPIPPQRMSVPPPETIVILSDSDEEGDVVVPITPPRPNIAIVTQSSTAAAQSSGQHKKQPEQQVQQPSTESLPTIQQQLSRPPQPHSQIQQLQQPESHMNLQRQDLHQHPEPITEFPGPMQPHQSQSPHMAVEQNQRVSQQSQQAVQTVNLFHQTRGSPTPPPATTYEPRLNSVPSVPPPPYKPQRLTSLRPTPAPVAPTPVPESTNDSLPAPAGVLRVDEDSSSGAPDIFELSNMLFSNNGDFDERLDTDDLPLNSWLPKTATEAHSHNSASVGKEGHSVPAGTTNRVVESDAERLPNSATSVEDDDVIVPPRNANRVVESDTESPNESASIEPMAGKSSSPITSFLRTVGLSESPEPPRESQVVLSVPERPPAAPQVDQSGPESPESVTTAPSSPTEFFTPPRVPEWRLDSGNPAKRHTAETEERSDKRRHLDRDLINGVTHPNSPPLPPPPPREPAINRLAVKTPKAHSNGALQIHERLSRISPQEKSSQTLQSASPVISANNLVEPNPLTPKHVTQHHQSNLKSKDPRVNVMARSVSSKSTSPPTTPSTLLTPDAPVRNDRPNPDTAVFPEKHVTHSAPITSSSPTGGTAPVAPVRAVSGSDNSSNDGESSAVTTRNPWMEAFPSFMSKDDFTGAFITDSSNKSPAPEPSQGDGQANGMSGEAPRKSSIAFDIPSWSSQTIMRADNDETDPQK